MSDETQVEATEAPEAATDPVETAPETVSDAIEEARPEDEVVEQAEDVGEQAAEAAEPEAADVSREDEIKANMRQTARENTARKRDLKTAHMRSDGTADPVVEDDDGAE